MFENGSRKKHFAQGPTAKSYQILHNLATSRTNSRHELQLFPTLRILSNCYIDHTVKNGIMEYKHQNQNRLLFYRRRMRFSQKYVSVLLGLKSASMVSRYERGRSLPPLEVAFGLGIVLRIPVEFLFPTLYEDLRKGIRAHEENLAQPIQQKLIPDSLLTSQPHA